MSPRHSHKSRSNPMDNRSPAASSKLDTKQSPSATPTRVETSTSNSRTESAYGENSHAWTTSSNNSKPVHTASLRLHSIEHPYPQHENVPQYAEQVIFGVSSLGIYIPPYLERTLVDQHGTEYLYSRIEENVELQYWNFSLSGEQAHWEERDDGLSGDLVGIGAQFDSQTSSAYVSSSRP
ncbi:uncharacterized protein LY89DRAFT_669063 [Mollisia scopiformis]|uniref:Uncharacterized protein n=1 Tax=Mollisia scopiformis TaxID=149040 RepID=A0A194XC85_MOLSC|nr:uncharacterized protein LY89DRAFT_669063 [Mollisia scopiformis]KUJ17774.1 hypothetical protein LY89DRAFT_669063 [Mollisia scopiformis]